MEEAGGHSTSIYRSTELDAEINEMKAIINGWDPHLLGALFAAFLGFLQSQVV